ncbi:G-type lectin S-receptor-like serine/threonine-protein kinase CES101 [Herrania umbratica]|uniref:G-type lectin S-receptor-like serine/threonine-protein kinase CES101 n=1 Tax=Herrania umbratica TaxID=108875 RepID=A0A6J1BC97_9ROSI|nr:G-type lectin S-receptor-like serine/threonine-protein kinase CES101 [Herrania umbratica]
MSNQKMFGFKVLLLILPCLWISDAATDTLTQGDKLNSSDSLVSQNGAVTLGFRLLQYGETWDDKRAGYYLAMWFSELESSPPIWLANRDDPIADNSGVLIIDNTGFKITHDGGDPIQLFSLHSTPTTTNSSNIKLVLQDSGNLVLQDADSKGENRILWQSFDYPTDTFLPGMKLGVSHGRSWSLTSWFTGSIPAPGSFTLEWDPEGERLIVRLKERVLWTSGNSFENIPPSEPQNMNYNFSHVSNVDEQYLYYTLLMDDSTREEKRKNARLILLYDGSLQLGSGEFIFSSKSCAGASTQNGCERWKGPKCRSNGDQYEIRSITPTDMNSVNYSLLGNTGLSIYDCKDICWKDCQCFGVKEDRVLGCQFLSGPYVQGALDGTSYQVIIRHRSRLKNWIWILISIAMTLLITVLLGVLFCLRRRRRIRMEDIDRPFTEYFSISSSSTFVSIILLPVENAGFFGSEMQLPLPKNPAFSAGRRMIETNVEEKEIENYSLNGLSMSVMDPR